MKKTNPRNPKYQHQDKPFCLEDKKIFLAPDGKKLLEYENEDIPLHISVEDIKQAVKLLKERLLLGKFITNQGSSVIPEYNLVEIIDKIFGKGLTE